jgi:class 3 adenylate cyclase
VLATVLFTDLVGSTEQARRLGDRRWRQLLDMHDELASQLIREGGGRLVKTTGDGFICRQGDRLGGTGLGPIRRTSRLVQYTYPAWAGSRPTAASLLIDSDLLVAAMPSSS